MKQDQVKAAPNSGAAVKEEDSLSYMLGSSLDQQQTDQQALQDAGVDMTSGAAATDSQTDNLQFHPRSSNPIAQGQGQAYGDKKQQCEKLPSSLSAITMPTERTKSLATAI